MKVVEFHHDLASIIRRIIGEPDLTTLDGRGFTLRVREDDQKTPWHQRFYSSREWLEEYNALTRWAVHEIVGEPCYVQAVPNLRVQLPMNLGVGEFHCDAWYGHPQGEVNFWLPLTPTDETSTIVVDSPEGLKPVCVQPGQALVFDAVNTYHGNRINRSGKSRVSIDFRLLPTHQYVPNGARTVNARLRFAPGEYYSLEPVT